MTMKHAASIMNTSDQHEMKKTRKTSKRIR